MNLGSLVFQIGADVSSLKKAEEVAADVARAMELAAGKAERFDQALKMQAQHIASGRAGLVNLHSIIQQVDRGFSSATVTINAATSATSKMERAISSTTAPLKQSAVAMAAGAVAAKQISEQTEKTSSSATAAELMLARLSKSVLSLATAYAIWREGSDVIQTGMDFQRLELSLKGISGSSEGARKEMTYIRDEVERLGMDLYSTADAYKLLAAASAGTSLEGQKTRDIFNSVSEAATVLGLKAEDTSLILYAVQQMMSKGVISSEELRRQMGDKLPGAFQLAAKSMNMTQAAFQKAIEQGDIMSSEFLPKFAAALHERYGGSVADSAKSAQAQLNRFYTAITELKNEIATGLLPTFTTMIQSLTDIARGFTDADGKAKQMLATAQAIAQMGTIDMGVNMHYVGMTPDQMIKEWNVGGSQKGIGDFFSGLDSGFRRFLKDPTGRSGMLLNSPPDITGQFREIEEYNMALRKINPELQRMNSVQNDAAKSSKDIGKAIETAKNIIKTAIPPTQKLNEQIANLDIAHKFGGISDKEYETARDFLISKLEGPAKKSGGTVPTPMELPKINQDLDKIMAAAAEAGKALQDLQYEYAILQRTGEGKLGQAEWLKTEKGILDQTFEAWKDISEAQEKYRETQEKLAGAKGGGTKEAFLELAAAKKYLDEAWSKGLQRIDLIPEIALEKFEQWNDQMKRAGEIELAQVNFQYAELTHNFKMSQEAQDQMVLASLREKIANANKDIPGLVEAYQKLYEIQQQIVNSPGGTYAHGKANEFTQPFLDSSRLMENYQAIYDQIEAMRQKDMEHEAAYQAAKVQLWMDTYGKQAQLFGQFFGNLASLMKEGSAEQRAMMIAQGTIQAILTGISVYQSVASSGIPYAWIVAPIMAAAAVAAQMATLAKAQSTPAYAMGGRPPVGRDVLVGERGPELMRFDRPGTIIPNHRLGDYGNGGSSRPNVRIYNYGTSKNFDVQLSEDEIRIIARDEAKGMVHKETDRVNANLLANPNSRTSRGIGDHTRTQRRRS